VTLEPDAEQLVRQLMRERNLTFKDAVNDLIRRGGSGAAARPFRTRTARMGTSRVNLDRALQISGALEDDDLVRRMRAGS
jgi:hypothetical protein